MDAFRVTISRITIAPSTTTGLGFACVENLWYYYNNAVHGFGAIVAIATIRTLFTAMLHCTSSAMLGMAIGYARHRKGAMRWVRDRLQDRLADLEHPEDPWCDVVAFVSSELAAVPIPEPGEVVLFTDVFQIGPYAFCPLPDSPGDCLDWMPYAEDVDPVDATADLAFTSEELALVLADTQVLLDYASELACGTE